MIIQCTNCNKNFKVNSTLIPETGRNIQCGSCNHTWYFQYINNTLSSNDQNITRGEANDAIKDNKTDINQNIDVNNDLAKKTTPTNLPKPNKINNFNLSKVLSYILVGITSLVALVIFLDTLKSPLNDLFPGLELLLYNLFETIKDISLFLKNLLV